jgi:hypothetical protein
VSACRYVYRYQGAEEEQFVGKKIIDKWGLGSEAKKQESDQTKNVVP